MRTGLHRSAPDMPRETALETDGVIQPDPWVHLAWITAGASSLKAWRHAADLSPRDLAARAGITPSALIRMESDMQPITGTQRLALAAALGVRVSDIED